MSTSTCRLYSADFSASGKNWQQWKEHKARLAKQYNKIKVDVQNLRILQNDGLVLASFIQKYGNEYFSSAGRKTIYLKHSSRWRIVGEHFEGAELKPSIKKEAPAPEEVKPVMAKKEHALRTEEEATPDVLKKEQRPAGGDEHKELRRVVGAWKKAWERKDLAVYMSFYDSGFQSRGMDFKAWKKNRVKLNQKYRSITVDISALKIERTSAVMATVSFTQKYEADDYEDEGLKSLLLVKRGKDWKIKEEEWKPLDQESRP